MQCIASFLLNVRHLLLLVVALWGWVAHAGEYTEIAQLINTGNLTQAMAQVDQHLLKKPKDPQLRFFQGVIQRNSGKTQEATSTFTRLIQDYPELPEPYNNLAVLHASQNQLDKARAALEMAIRINPGYGTAQENLGDVYAKLASQSYSKALQLSGTNSALSQKIAVLRELLVHGATKNQKASSNAITPNQTALTTPVRPAPGGTTSGNAVMVLPQQPALRGGNTTRARPNVNAEIQATLQTWANAWSKKDMTTYLGAYADNFDPSGVPNRQAWENEQRKSMQQKGTTRVQLEDVNITVHANKAMVKLRQIQETKEGAIVTSHKTLNLAKEGAHWRITREYTRG